MPSEIIYWVTFTGSRRHLLGTLGRTACDRKADCRADLVSGAALWPVCKACLSRVGTS